MTFEKIYQNLFTDKNFVDTMKAFINKNTGSRISSREYYISEINKIEEHTKWDALITNPELGIVKDNFLTLIDLRNDVMHAHNIDYMKYYKANKLFSMVNVVLEKELNQLINVAEYRNQSSDEIKELLNNLLSVEMPDEWLDALYELTK